MNKTPIGWTDFSSNLLKYRTSTGQVVWACIKASEGCRHCYAEALKKRWWPKVLRRLLGLLGWKFSSQNMKKLEPFFVMKEALEVLKSREISGKRVFVNDMTDWAGPWVPDKILDYHFALFALRPDVTFQTLTKHPDRLLRYMDRPASLIVDRICKTIGGDYPIGTESILQPIVWPLPNVHIGISAETQKWFASRWGYLRRIPAALRWISFEPLLGAIDAQTEWWEDLDEFVWPDWVVIGGESGAGHRVMDLDVFKSLVNQCKQVCEVFVKQDSGSRPGQQGRIPDEYWIHEFPKAA